MELVRLEKIYSDGNHNAFTDICYFKGDYYVTFRTASRHIHSDARALVLRGRPDVHPWASKTGDVWEGPREDKLQWMPVASIYSGLDTRDPHFMIKDGELFVYAFSYRRDEDEARTRHKVSGFSKSRAGDQWTRWKAIEEEWVYWAPKWHDGAAYVIAYSEWQGKAVLKKSLDGKTWKTVCTVSDDAGPNETSILFDEKGTMHALIRRAGDGHRPFLSSARPPYKKWTHKKLDASVTGPLLFHVDGAPWICGRWHLESGPQTAIFRVEGTKCVPQLVLPSGGDNSYAGIVRKQGTDNRYYLTYYSQHADLRPWTNEGVMPADIYLAELALP